MKYKLRLHFVLIVTGLIFTLVNPFWRYLDTLKEHHPIINVTSLALIWAETCLVVGAFGLIISIIIPAFSKFFIGFESKKAEEGEEIFYYVIMTLFVISLGLLGYLLPQSPPRNVEKDVKYLCGVLNDNLDVSNDDAMQDKVDTICGDDDPVKPEPSGKTK